MSYHDFTVSLKERGLSSGRAYQGQGEKGSEGGGSLRPSRERHPPPGSELLTPEPNGERALRTLFSGGGRKVKGKEKTELGRKISAPREEADILRKFRLRFIRGSKLSKKKRGYGLNARGLEATRR